MTLRLTILAALALALTGCPPPMPAPQGTIEPQAPDQAPLYRDRCKSACQHQRDLGCPRGFPSSKGTSCETVCENTYANASDFMAGCLASATDCSPCR